MLGFLLARVHELEGVAARLDPKQSEVRAARHLCRDTRRRIRQGRLTPRSARYVAYDLRHHTSRLRALARKETADD